MFYFYSYRLQLPEPAKTPDNNRRSGSKRTLSMAQTPNPAANSEKISPLQKQQKTIETENDTEFMRKSTEAVSRGEPLVEEEDDDEEEEVSPLRKQRRTIESHENVTSRRSKDSTRRSTEVLTRRSTDVVTRRSTDGVARKSIEIVSTRKSIEDVTTRRSTENVITTRRSKSNASKRVSRDEELIESPDKISPLRKSAKAKENAENITPPRPTKSPNQSPKSTELSPKRTPTKRAAVSPVASSRNTRNAAKKVYQSNNIMTRGRQVDSHPEGTTSNLSSLAKTLFPKKLPTTKVSKIPVKRGAVTTSTATSDTKDKTKQQTSLPANKISSTLRSRIPTVGGTTTSSKPTVNRIALRKRKT